MKTKLMLAGVLVTMSFPALAMDEAERARQMELYANQNNGGAVIETQTTVDASGDVTTTTTAAPAYSTEGLSQRSLPEDAKEPVTQAQVAPAVVNDNKMEPIVEGAVVAQTTVPDPEPESVDGVMTAQERDAQLKAYEEYARANGAPAASAPADAAAVTAVNGPVTGAAPVALSDGTTTTTEKTTTTTYTVTTRKVGLVGGRPYPAKTSDVAGGVTMERTVNGVLDKKEVVVPDTVADVKDQRAEGDYFSADPNAEVYENTNSDVRVHDMGMGRLND